MTKKQQFLSKIRLWFTVGVAVMLPVQLHALDIPQSNAHLLPQNQFNYGDVNLTKGTVQFTETDLRLPGLNGLDLLISRTYNSQHYQSSASQKLTSTKTFGPGFGGGWSLNVIQRAFYVNASDDNKDKIVIEVAGQATSYVYNKDEGVFLSNIPGNESRAVLIDSGVRLMTTSGLSYSFELPMYQERHKSENGIRLEVYGFYLTNIEDRFGSSIAYEYSDVNKTIDQKWNKLDHKGKAISRVIGGSAYDWLKKDVLRGAEPKGISEYHRYIVRLYSHTAESEHQIYSLTKIIDTFGREIKFNWQDPESEENGSLLRRVTYTNDNGSENEIVYEYEESLYGDNAFLSAIKVNGLNMQSYSYTDYDTEFLYFQHYEKRWGNWRHHCLKVGYPGDYESTDHGGHDKANKLSSLDDYNGYLISKREYSLGVSVEYEYKESLMVKYNGNGFLEVTHDDDFLQSHAIYPVVVEKKVINEKFASPVSEEDKDSLTKFTFTYPTWRGRYHNVKNYYTPSYLEDQSIRIYYFDSVTVQTEVAGKLIVEEEKYSFKNGLLSIKEQGQFKTETEWDTDSNLKLSETSFVAGEQRQKMTFSYDDNRNLVEKKTYESEENTPYLVETISYYIPDDFSLDEDDDYAIELMTHFPRYTLIEGENGGKREKTMSYTNKGKLETEEVETSYGKQSTHYSYDEKGRVVETKVQGGAGGALTHTVKYEEDEEAETYVITKSTNGKNTETHYNRDTGRVYKKVGVNGEIGYYTYDNLGNLLFKTYPNGQQEQYSYSEDYKTVTRIAAGKKVIFYKDDYGRVIEIDRPDGELDTAYGYYIGKKINARYEREGAGSWELIKSHKYDSYLREVETEDSDWGSTTTTYDDENNSVSNFDILGREKKDVKNSRGQTIESIAYYADGNDTQSYVYNEFGEVIQFVDPKETSYYIDFSEDGRTTAVVYHPTAGDAKQKWKVFDYYANGLTKEVELYDDEGKFFTRYAYDYDSENRLTKIEKEGELKEWLAYDETYHNNGIGKLTTAENDHVKTSYDYDNMGRVTQETTTIKSIDKSYAISTAYMDEGPVSSVTFDDNKSILYSYDDTLKVTAVDYDNSPVIEYRYDDSDSKLTDIALGDSASIRYEYDDKDLLTNLVVENSAGNVLYEHSYSYNDIGQVVASEYSHPLTGKPTKRQYSYTERQELEEVFFDDETEALYHYDYDKLGNMLIFTLSERSGPVTVQANVTIGNELTEQLYEDGREVNFIYDVEGQMIQKTKIQNNIAVRDDAYIYNYQGQIETITRNDDHLATYYYNHKKERVYANTTPKSGDSIETWYYNDGRGNIIGEGNSEQDYAVRYIYYGNEKIAMIRPDGNGDEEIYYFVNNAQGTPVMILSAAGGVVSRINLDAWGNPEGIQVASKFEINFTGKKYDTDTGLYYFNQRYYDPEQGRFLSHDPASQTLNPYVYAGNNPMMYVDPDGEWFFKLWVNKMAQQVALIGGAVNMVAGGSFEDGYHRGQQLGILMFDQRITTQIGALYGGVNAIQNGGNVMEGVLDGAEIGSAIPEMVKGGAIGAAAGSIYSLIKHGKVKKDVVEWWGASGASIGGLGSTLLGSSKLMFSYQMYKAYEVGRSVQGQKKKDYEAHNIMSRRFRKMFGPVRALIFGHGKEMRDYFDRDQTTNPEWRDLQNNWNGVFGYDNYFK